MVVERAWPPKRTDPQDRMPKRKEPELTPAEQCKRFKKTAKEAGVSESEEEFERVFKKVVPLRGSKKV